MFHNILIPVGIVMSLVFPQAQISLN